MTLSVTETEKTFFQTLTSNPVEVIENGVSLQEYSWQERVKKKQKTILFVGNFDYFPNVDAVMFFNEKVFKKIQDPDVIFSIIGRGSTQFSSGSDRQVKTTEFVQDIRQAYYDADIFVSPIKIGGGTNFKILEAMATGLPVVTFSDRIRDLGAKDEVDVLVADSEDTFLAQVQRLLDEPELGQRLSKNARKIIEKKYSWDIIGTHLSDVWRKLYESR